MNDLIYISSKFNEELKVVTSKNESNDIKEKKEVFQDVYEILTKHHYSKDNYSKSELLDKAIE
jgi:hypothetical protein